MSISPGTPFGQYEIVESIGKGGMGEVWRAHDTKLERDIAIKTLPSTFADDADRLARFEREAKLLASLNHANIASIYGLDEHAGTHFLAMELVQGETLEQRLKAGALPVDEALRIALQIAHALEAAHASGVVHRDLKPANIMLTDHDQVKVLDFGLAKAFAGNPMEASPAHSPALSVAMTQAGLILGTAGYMSPEQASGQATDQRADIWAFGVVVYEMLTGLPLFSGESVPHVLADVLRADPDWTRLPKRLHPRVRQLLERCLEKKVRNRYHAIADARVDIEAALADPEGATIVDAGPAAVARRPFAQRLASSVAIALAGAAIAALVAWTLWPEAEQPRVTRFRDVVTVPSGDIGEIEVSQDGSRIAYMAGRPVALYVRSLDAFDAHPIEDTIGMIEDVGCFSPAGDQIAYIASNGTLRKAPVAGGRSLPLAEDARLPGTCDWAADGYVYFGQRDPVGGIARVPDTGGSVEHLTTVLADEGELIHLYPQLLPGGELLLYSAFGGDFSTSDVSIAIMDMATREQTTLLERAGFVQFVPSGDRATLGHLIYGFDGALFAAPFDVARRVIGAPSPVLDDIAGASLLTVVAGSASGTLAYFSASGFLGGVLEGATTGNMALNVIDRSGEVTSIPTPPGVHGSMVPAPDEQSVVLGTLNSADIRAELWNFETDNGRYTPITFEGHNVSPVFTLDASHLIYTRAGTIAMTAPRLMSLPADRSDQQPVTLMTLQRRPVQPSSIHPTEPVLMGVAGLDTEPGDIFLYTLPDDLSVESDATEADLEFLLVTDFDERHPKFSPDGRWVAYSSDESGRREIYVVPYPGPGRKEQVSVTGGFEPHWSPSGDEIFFRTDTAIMVAGVPTAAPGGRFRAETPRVFIDDANLVGMPPVTTANASTYAVTGDGERVMVLAPGGTGSLQTEQISIVQNWFEELRELAPFPEGWE